MVENRVREVSLAALIILGVTAVASAYSSTGVSAKFLLAFYPLLVVLVGVAFLR